MDGLWYEFNDNKVYEVAKNYAMRQGYGGDISDFEVIKNGLEEGSSCQLNESFADNNTNAYMLIYVREKEREAIMSDNLEIDEQIPVELQSQFQIEE